MVLKILSLLLLSVILIHGEGVLIQTQYGPINGTTRVSAVGTTYYSFQRIPYMKPPIGRLRFRDAEAPDAWTEPLDCTQEGPRFPQIDFTFEVDEGQFSGDLDSMHINVYTNDINPDQPYPVLVWIHGGGFRSGSARTDIYGPDYFMERNVVLVTFNYRLYAFGFLSLDDPQLEIPGNAGMKDQVLALKWIKQNIGNFGGDPQNITIFGQSSGGGCAHYHIVTDASKDLFQRSIIMSGSAFNSMYAAIPRRNWALRLSRALNYTGPDDERQMLSFLEVADPEDIFHAVGNLLTPEERNDERILNAFGPTIEPYARPNAFMLDHPERLAVNSWGNGVDIMIGATSFENGALVNLIRMVPPALALFTNFTTWVPYNLDHTAEEREKHGESLKSAYYGLTEPSVTNVDGLVFVANEFAFVHSTHRVVQQRWRSGGAGKSFVYRFDADTDNNCFSVLHRVDPIYRRPIHMDDLCHLFKTSFAAVPPINGSGWRVTQWMLNIFTNFAATGDPHFVDWKPSTGADEAPPLFGCNIHESNPVMGRLAEASRMEVWDELYPIESSGGVKALNFIIFVAAILIKIVL